MEEGTKTLSQLKGENTPSSKAWLDFDEIKLGNVKAEKNALQHLKNADTNRASNFQKSINKLIIFFQKKKNHKPPN